MRMPPRLHSFWVALAAFSLAATAPAFAEDPPQYNRDVRPILAEHCFACHGPDSASRKADLRLDRRDDAIRPREGGSSPIVPGKPDDSEIIYRVEETEASVVMPPPEIHKDLSDAQKQTLRRWVEAGAEYQPHWSFIAPSRPLPPQVKNEAWVKNPIDRFVLAGIEAAGLEPAPEADRLTLARRAALDITGLPPSPEVAKAFLDDHEPGAFERYVDRLMQSPAWGEHRARYWLDAARYADTHGYHFDNRREMWSYRDEVVAAFNRNEPFDQFTIEQLAGDLLPNATLEQRIASGFNRCNMTTNEGGTIPEENLAIYMKDRTETTAAVWLGLTANCAGCHDHKFDPLTQKEYYELAAFFNNTTQDALDGNIQDTPPIIFVPADEDRPRWDALQGELSAAKSAVDERTKASRAEFDAWLAAQTPDTFGALVPVEAIKFQAPLTPRDDAAPALGETSRLAVADVGDFEKDQAWTIAAWVRPLQDGASGAIAARMEDRNGYRGWDFWIENGRPGMHLVKDWPADALKAVAETPLPVGKWTHVTVRYDGSARPEGLTIAYDGQPQKKTVTANTLKSSIKTTVAFKVGQRESSSVLDRLAVSDLRLYARGLGDSEIVNLAGATRGRQLATRPAAERPAAEVEALFAWWSATQDPAAKQLREKLVTLEQEQQALKARGTIAHVMQEKPQQAMAYVLARGDYDKRQDEVHPDTPDMLPPFAAELPRNRLGLAQWLLAKDNPLTARVAVNRYWQELFGAGLVRTAGDFGISGELPTHPELLDWLAVEFRDSGWDTKAIFRLMLTSAAYRQSAQSTPEKLEKDPQNKLLARGPRFRMDAEMVRDYALQASGLLVEKLGGPSVRPYQPSGVWEAVAMPESNTRMYQADAGDALYRRSIYTFWKRAAPPALMDIFNAPSREVCTVRRERTNTPLQALATLNDPEFIEAARHLAEQTLSAQPEATREAVLDAMAWRVLVRPLHEEERSVALESLSRLLAYYEAHPDSAAELLAVGQNKPADSLDPKLLAAWTMVGNQLLNLDEALNK